MCVVLIFAVVITSMAIALFTILRDIPSSSQGNVSGAGKPEKPVADNPSDKNPVDYDTDQDSMMED